MKLQILLQLKVKSKMLLLWMMVMVWQLPLSTGKNAPVSTSDNQEILLIEAIQQISEKYQVLFNYDRSIVSNVKVNYDPAVSSNVDEAISSVLKDTDLKYHMFNHRYVVIYKNDRQGIESLKEMIRHFQEIVDDKEEDIKRELVPTPKLLRTSIINSIDSKKLVLDVTGKVVDVNGTPLIGVNVLVKGTDNGTATDFNGEFTLNDVNENAVIVFSYIGYQTTEVPISGRTNLNITLSEDTQTLEEVVVVGYGSQKKADLTGAVAQVGTEELEALPVYNVEQALIGRASGVQVTQNSGQPGSRIEVRIRGGNSMIGSNGPLYVVDGFPVTGGINFLNPSDIESMNILKDASATAIYGARGANGVVIITTKRGTQGESGKISFSGYYGVQNEINRFDVLDAKQYAEVANEWLRNNGDQPFFDVNQVQDPGTDWQDIIFRAAPVQNYTLDFSGRTDKTNYSLSGNFYQQDGIIINSGVKKGSFRLNLDHDIKDWVSLATNLNISRRQNRTVPVNNGTRGNNLYSGALSAPPTLPVYDENGQYTRIEQIYSFGSIDMRNPLLWSEPRKSQTVANTILFNSALDFKLAKGLTFKSRFGLEYEDTESEGFSPIIFPNDRGGASTRNSGWNSFLNENTLNYALDFNDNSKLTLLAGNTYQSYRSQFTSISVSGFSNNITENYNLGSAETINPPSSGISEWKLVSFLGRGTYDFQGKYYLTASVRADGSSRFGDDNKWGVFPSGAIAWRISEEEFLKDNANIDNLKLRFSYGVTGNTALSPYQSLNRLSSVKYIYGDNSESVGFAPSGIANSQLRWETTNEFDVGLDFALLNGKFDFTLDYYRKNTFNLLASVPLPPSVGFGSILQNVGEIQNQGVEFSAGVNIFDGDFKWDIRTQVSTNNNKVVKLAGDSDVISSGQSTGLSGMNIARVGEPLGSFFGYVENGLDENGLIKYQDINNDDLINAADRIILGTPYPDFIYGFNTNLSYKGFDLNIFFQGSVGNDIFFRTAYTNLNSFQRGQNQFADLFGNYWTAENPNPNAKYPVISSQTQMRASNRFIEDGSYLRLKSIQLAYNLPLNKWGLTGFEYGRIYIKGTNLLTFTDYIGLDPEVNTAGTDSQSIGSRLQIGIDESAYPSSKVIGAGVQLNF
ncbi:SusC/RagA family TonB-linked outer membrane protein [Membranihabitans maritimus]|uniref:SusC/RagA family TonB-linked outer membrane protein n=1 Tax=Membranihabitans maritimus TaxID=2904244 RepID=UPI001F3247C9|nr:TonB-dependent receptor [Membranihabitans maritimus]